ncbi:DUF1932 domain-containing protein [Actinomycetota bacterium Odt1-20B]
MSSGRDGSALSGPYGQGRRCSPEGLGRDTARPTGPHGRALVTRHSDRSAHASRVCTGHRRSPVGRCGSRGSRYSRVDRMTVLGILHPGSMGAAVAAQAKKGGVEVLWCSSGRGPETKERAERAGLTDVRSVAEMARHCDIIMSLCPPANAEDLAAEVAAVRFGGIYVDANAIAPATMSGVAAALLPTSATVIDGSVVGSPPAAGKHTRLYLSGPEGALAVVSRVFTESVVDVRLLGDEVGRASALKLSYSSFQKASRVLASVAYALASDHDVQDELLDIAQERTTSYLSETAYIPKVAARAWRWAPEMREAASALVEAGLPPELAEAAASVMERWKGVKDTKLGLEEALERLHGTG